MARPTTDKKGCTVILRINEETRSYLEEMAKGETISSYVRSMIQKEKNGEFNVIQNQRLVDKAIYSDIEVMCKFYGIDTATFFKELCKSMNEGEVVYEDGVIKGKSEIDLSRFMEVCHEKKKDPQEVLDRCVMMIGRL